MAKRRRAELKEMRLRFKETEDPEIRGKLIEAYLPLVRYTAERLKGKLPQCVDLQEMISAGWIGLINAVDKFDPGRGILFEPYCSMRIRGAILDDLRSGDWVPRLIRSKAHKLEKAKLSLAFELGREPEDREIARRMRLKLSEFYALLKEVHVKAQLPIEGGHSDTDDDDDTQRIDLIEDRSHEHPLDRLSLKEVRDVALKGLSPNERVVLIGYYFENKTMKEIGEGLGISESRVCQINAQMMRLLRERFKAQMEGQPVCARKSA